MSSNQQLMDDIFGKDDDNMSEITEQSSVFEVQEKGLSKASQAKVLAGTHKIVLKNGKKSIKKIGIREQKRNKKLQCGIYALDRTGKLRKRTKGELELIIQEYCNQHKGIPAWADPEQWDYAYAEYKPKKRRGRGEIGLGKNFRVGR